MNAQSEAPTQDDRILAALAHVTALLPFMGVLAPVVIWATQKDKSPYVSFQALQAVAYQLTMILAWFVGIGCYMCSFFMTFGGLMAEGLGQSPDGSPNILGGIAGMLAFAMPFLVMGLMFVGGGAFILYGLVGAVQTLRGKAFRYIIIGARLEQYLRQGRPSQPAGTSQS